ncbi:MAG: GspMb/PilO family protein, partial [Acidobacteria bacterium]|nr:GspMb/PilO family protein [Acidobacteriota bacterium]
MNMSERDRRALILLSVTVVLIVILRFIVYGDKPANVVAATDSIPLAEKRLARLRQLASTVPGKETLLKDVTKELAEREKGILATETAAQAQAQILQTVRSIGKTEGIEVRGADLGAVRQLGGGYGEVQVAVSFECRIEQLVNFLAALAN